MTTSDHPPNPASAPWIGTAGGATSRCADLARAYLRLVDAIRVSTARDDTTEEDRLRNRAQVMLYHMRVLGCPPPDPAEMEL